MHVPAENHESRERIIAAQSRARERPRPRPLLIPVIALLLGIWLSESVGELDRPVRYATCIAPLAAIAITFAFRRHLDRWAWRWPLALALLAASVGVARHQATFVQPANHVAHILKDEPLLTRLSGTVLNTPVLRHTQKRNEFLPFTPPDRTQFVIALHALHTQEPPLPVAGRVQVTIEGHKPLRIKPGQLVRLTGRLFAPHGPRNPGEPDWRQWYRRQGIDAGLSVNGPAHVQPLSHNAPSPRRWVHFVRTRAQQCLLEPHADIKPSETSRLLDVMVLGQRRAASRALNTAFAQAGGMHFLAASGFHVGVVAGAAFFAIRRVLRRSQRAAAITMLATSVAYALIAEPNAPILRATIIVVCMSLALLTSRPLCLLNWLALAAAVVLWKNPLELFRPGFQLSFVVVTGLILIVPRVYRIPFSRSEEMGSARDAHNVAGLVRKWLIQTAWAFVVVGVTAWLVALPLTAYHFERIAPWGALGSILLSPLAMLIIVGSLLTITLTTVLPPAGDLLRPLVHTLSSSLLDAADALGKLPAADFELHAPPAWLVVATYLGLLTWLLTRRHELASGLTTTGLSRARRQFLQRTTVVGTSTLVLLTLAWTGWLIQPPRLPAHTQLDVLAVGNGSAMTLATRNGHAVVIDIGTITNTDVGDVARRALRSLGRRRVAAAIISHANFDHYSGLPSLASHIDIERWASSPYFLKQLPGNDELIGRVPDLGPPDALKAGDKLTFGDTTLEVLWPPTDLDASWHANDCSLVIRIHAGDRSVLATGDIEARALSALLSRHASGEVDLRADVLIAPHHGSVLKDVTAAFYEAVDPGTVIVSSHTPRPRVEDLVRATLGTDCRVLMTGTVGTVRVTLRRDGVFTCETPFQLPPPARTKPPPVTRQAFTKQASASVMESMESVPPHGTRR